jgi:geranylgeranyl pyrophosphate synthase
MARLIENIRESAAIQKSVQEANEFIQRAVAHLGQFPPGVERSALESLASYIVDRSF